MLLENTSPATPQMTIVGNRRSQLAMRMMALVCSSNAGNESSEWARIHVGIVAWQHGHMQSAARKGRQRSCPAGQAAGCPRDWSEGVPIRECAGRSGAVDFGGRADVAARTFRRDDPRPDKGVSGAEAAPAAGLAHVSRPTRGAGSLEGSGRRAPGGCGGLGSGPAAAHTGARGRCALAG